MSPTPGRSTLITSAPNQASSCVHVGPDWTWVKWRMRTPSSALPPAPKGLALGGGMVSARDDLKDGDLGEGDFSEDFFAGILLTALRFTGAFFAAAFALMLLLFQ